MNDTSKAAAALQLSIYRKLTGSQRLAIAFDLSETVRNLALARLRTTAPRVVGYRTQAGADPLRVPTRRAAPSLPVTDREVLQRVTSALERAGIAYMITGSFASSFHGAPRSSQDIDIVIAPTPGQVRSLVGLLPATEYYVDLNAALDAQGREGLFNVIDLASGWKIDFIMRKSRPFSREEFERRFVADHMGIPLWFATAEDVLLAKLEWAKRSGSERQVEDAAGIWRIRSKELDRAYVENWVRELGLEEQWNDARRAGGDAD